MPIDKIRRLYAYADTSRKSARERSAKIFEIEAILGH